MSKQTVLQFAKAINEQDLESIYALMADDHRFIDAHGNEVTGRDNMKAGWAGYFQWFPDYKIEIRDIFGDGETLAAFGFAEGTFRSGSKEDHWRLPAAWKIVAANNKIRVWQVYADTKIPFDIIAKNS